MDKKNPYIFIIDLDNTIIGDCTYQSELFFLLQLLKSKKKNTIYIEDILAKAYKEKSKLIRPYFSNFIHQMKKKYRNSSFFVYTASEKVWGLKEISMIEKGLNITFDKPIFTRDDCIKGSGGSYNKSIKKILPKIISSLKKSKKGTENISDRILVIDNYNSYIDYNSNLYICPSYSYILFYNLWDVLRREYLKINEVNLFITRAVQYNLISYTNLLRNDYYNIKKMRCIYKWLFLKTTNINKHNKTQENDVFWKKFLHILNVRKLNKIDSNAIKKIRRSLKYNVVC